jgi:aminocarboxymuconate-semialdehyde decarboxylase
MSLADAKVIDLHAHAVLEETFGTAGSFGPELSQEGDLPVFRIGDYRLRGVRYRGSAFMDVDVRIAAMDRCRIDWQLLSPNPLTISSRRRKRSPSAAATTMCWPRRWRVIRTASAQRRPCRCKTSRLPLPNSGARCASWG